MRKTNVCALRIAVLLTVLAMSSIAHLHAQSRQGTLEIGIDAGPFLLMATGGREAIGVIGAFGQPHVDYFLADELSIGAAGFFYHSLDSDPSLPPLSFGGAYSDVNYHFSSGSHVSPYIGVRIGVLIGEAVTQFGAGVQLGLQWFVSHQFSINGQLSGAAYPGSDGVALLSTLGLGVSYHTD